MTLFHSFAIVAVAALLVAVFGVWIANRPVDKDGKQQHG